jgi:hypothetical protein
VRKWRVCYHPGMRMTAALITCVLVARTVHGAGPACPSAAGADTHPVFDAALLKEGRFTYRTTLKGKLLGETLLEVRRIGTSYRISMSAPEIAQSWQATVEKSFAPLTASLSMQGKKGAYTMNLSYAGAKITGEEREAGVTRPVNARAEGVTIDQRVDWASMIAVKSPERGALALKVFDPGSGSSEMLGRIGEAQPLSGAWGDATALRLDYTICKREHLEQYTVYATQEAPRYMLREDMPNGLVSELIRIQAP